MRPIFKVAQLCQAARQTKAHSSTTPSKEGKASGDLEFLQDNLLSPRTGLHEPSSFHRPGKNLANPLATLHSEGLQKLLYKSYPPESVAKANRKLGRARCGPCMSSAEPANSLRDAFMNLTLCLQSFYCTFDNPYKAFYNPSLYSCFA